MSVNNPKCPENQSKNSQKFECTLIDANNTFTDRSHERLSTFCHWAVFPGWLKPSIKLVGDTTDDNIAPPCTNLHTLGSDPVFAMIMTMGNFLSHCCIGVYGDWLWVVTRQSSREGRNLLLIIGWCMSQYYNCAYHWPSGHHTTMAELRGYCQCIEEHSLYRAQMCILFIRIS